MEPKKPRKVFAGLKMDAALKESLEDYAWIKKTTFSSLMEEIGKAFIEDNPLSTREKSIVTAFKQIGEAGPDPELKKKKK